MILVDDERLRDKCLTLRGWGRRSERQLYGSRITRNLWEDLDGVSYDSTFIFDEVGWNFLPNELNAAFGVQQLDKLDLYRERRRVNCARYVDCMSRYPGTFILPGSPRGSTRSGSRSVSSSTLTPASDARSSRSSSRPAASTPGSSGPATPLASP